MADTRSTLPDIFAVMRDPNLTDQEVRLWGIYRSYDHGDGAYPGDETIQDHMASVDEHGRRRPKSLRAIQSYRASLIRKGYLIRELRGPNPAVYRAVVPAERGARSCIPRGEGVQDPASLGVKNPAPQGQAPQNPAPLEVQESAPLGEGVQKGVQKGVQDPALSPTPPIVDEYGEYGETAGEEEKPDSSGARAIGTTTDGFDEFADLYPEALAVLKRMTHRGGARGTAATLRTSYLYGSVDGALPDRSVQGLDLAQRQELVARALLEMQDQGVREWSSRALAGFVRRVRDRPDPEGGHPGMTAAEEEEREQNRREAARSRRASTEEETRLTAQAREVAEELAEDLRLGRAWLESQPPATQEQVRVAHLAKLRAQGWRGDQDRAPVQLSAPTLMAAIKQVQDGIQVPARQAATA